MPQYEVYIPLNYNDGRPIEQEKLHQTKEELAHRFGGLTNFPPGTPAEGLWIHKGELVRDDIVIFRIITTLDDVDADDYLTKYKEILKQRFQQQEILITKMPAHRL